MSVTKITRIEEAETVMSLEFVKSLSEIIDSCVFDHMYVHTNGNDFVIHLSYLDVESNKIVTENHICKVKYSDSDCDCDCFNECDSHECDDCCCEDDSHIECVSPDPRECVNCDNTECTLNLKKFIRN